MRTHLYTYIGAGAGIVLTFGLMSTLFADEVETPVSENILPDIQTPVDTPPESFPEAEPIPPVSETTETVPEISDIPVPETPVPLPELTPESSLVPETTPEPEIPEELPLPEDTVPLEERIDALPDGPQNIFFCARGAWEQEGFENMGECVRAVRG